MLASGSDFSDSMLCCCGSNELVLTRSECSSHISMLTESQFLLCRHSWGESQGRGGNSGC